MTSLAILLDGTDDARRSHSAIGRLADAMEHEGHLVHYERGVAGVRGTIYGHGFRQRVEEALATVRRVRPSALIVAGFSRGGAEAIAVASALAGTRSRPSLLMLFDPVAALIKHRAFPRPDVHIVSALAADEVRRPFWPITWSKSVTRGMIEQRWFSGMHSDIGGRTSGPALDWMVTRLPSWAAVASVAPPSGHRPRAQRLESSLLPHRPRTPLVGTLAGEIALGSCM